MSELRVLFPCNPLDPKQVDPEFSDEYTTVRVLGGSVALFDYDLVKSGSIEEGLSKLPELKGGWNMSRWFYRGWMMDPFTYKGFYLALQNKGFDLHNNPIAYKTCHVFKDAYPFIAEKAVLSYFAPGPDLDYDKFVSEIGGWAKGGLFVKDYVKSAKGVDGASYIKNYMDRDEVVSVTNRLKEERGNLFYGGFCFKELLDISKEGNGEGHNEEYRGFFFDGELVSWYHTFGMYPSKPFPMDLLKIAKTMPSLMTIDVAYTSLDDYKIIEVGDGGVSGLSPNQIPIGFYTKLEYIMNEKSKTVL